MGDGGGAAFFDGMGFTRLYERMFRRSVGVHSPQTANAPSMAQRRKKKRVRMSLRTRSAVDLPGD
jgi:hypothetical protein